MEQETPIRCDRCARRFLLTAGGGRYVPEWRVRLCKPCEDTNHSGFSEMAWPRLRAHLTSNKLSFFERDGWLHWRKEALGA
jgi:hypothetical protein